MLCVLLLCPLSRQNACNQTTPASCFISLSLSLSVTCHGPGHTPAMMWGGCFPTPDEPPPPPPPIPNNIEDYPGPTPPPKYTGRGGGYYTYTCTHICSCVRVYTYKGRFLRSPPPLCRSPFGRSVKAAKPCRTAPGDSKYPSFRASSLKNFYSYF